MRTVLQVRRIFVRRRRRLRRRQCRKVIAAMILAVLSAWASYDSYTAQIPRALYDGPATLAMSCLANCQPGR